MNKLEKLQESTNGIRFIKSFPILNKLNIRPTEVKIIELVLSYQDNNQQFFMNYSDIAELLVIGKQTVKDCVSRLKKLTYLTTKNSSNYNGKDGGSSTTLFVNVDKIAKDIDAIPTEKVVKVTPKKETKPTVVVIPKVAEVVLEGKYKLDDEIDLYTFPMEMGYTTDEVMTLRYQFDSSSSKMVLSEFVNQLGKIKSQQKYSDYNGVEINGTHTDKLKELISK